jgi:hypothetical protein
LRLAALVLAVTATVLAAPATVRADSPTPQPAASAAASALPAGKLGDADIRALLVGNSYTFDYRDGMRITVDVHADGVLFGYVSDGAVRGFRMGSAAAREQDDGKYTIGNGQYCWQFNGPWARKDGKPACAAITRTDSGVYMLGSTRIAVTQGKK